MTGGKESVWHTAWKEQLPVVGTASQRVCLSLLTFMFLS